MKLENLFNIQRILDERIEMEHPPEDGEDRFQKKILALQVELAETANEWHGFKFWSNNQKPNLIQYDHEGTLCYPLLEEFVDVLYFILSIGIDHYNEHIESYDYQPVKRAEVETIEERLSYLMSDANALHNSYNYICYVNNFIELGQAFGFTREQMTDAYMSRYSVNEAKQDSGTY